MNKKIKVIHKAYRDDIADLITHRPLPSPSLPHLDPFLFLNHHGPLNYPRKNRGLPFGPHPHRGFETITFILKGDIAHHDTAGHTSIIKAGGVQWMTAGRGLIHSEVSSDEFKRDGGELEILQLWVNLPSHLKMTEPRYVGLQEQVIPRVELSNGRGIVKIISGQWEQKFGALRPLTDLSLFEIQLNAKSHLQLPLPAEETVFFYLVAGSIRIEGAVIRAMHLVEFEGAGTSIDIQTEGEVTLLFGHGKPHNEPIISYGPFVMNSREEILQAIRDVETGVIK